MARTTNNPKLERLTFRLSSEETEALKAIRSGLRLSKSAAARKALLIVAGQLKKQAA